MTNTQIIEKLRLAVIAYKAAQEYDLCPDSEAVQNVKELFGYELNDVYDAIHEHQGRRPDEIACDICDWIDTLTN